MNRAIVSTLGSMLLLLSACTSEGPETPPSPPVETVDPLISSLPTNCGALGKPSDSGEVTFLADGRLYSALPDGSDARCLTRLPEGDRLTWGGEGDRVAIDTSDGGLVVADGSRDLLDPNDVDSRFQGWSRPTGTSLVYISADGQRLFKLPVEGGEPEDISFLSRHDEVAYHPSGTSVIVVGESLAGEDGLFFATNRGAESRLLAIAEDAIRIYSLAFSHDGRTLYYAAEHDDRFDLHSLALTEQGTTGSTEAEVAERLGTLHQSQRSIGNVVVSEFAEKPLLAFTEGGCETGTEAFVWNGETVEQVDVDAPSHVTTPVGWLPDGGLLVTTRPDGCDQPATLRVWRGGSAEVLLTDVSQAAVRAVLPSAPKPLIPAEGVVP